jgi:hypothetical protein
MRHLIAVFTIAVIAYRASAAEADLSPKPPKFTLTLNLNEFSIFNVAEMDGLSKYGGSGNFQLEIARVHTNVVWNVTITGGRSLELLGIFLGERTVKLVQGLDANNLDSNEKIALEAIKSLTRKLDDAQRNPVWDSVRITGMLGGQGTNWTIQAPDATLRLSGEKLSELQGWDGRAIVADGFIKVPGEFELTDFLDARKNTLELFVMSACPFGQRAEAKVLAFLSQTNDVTRPRLEVHYIFYKQQKDGHEVFSSLHGEEEIIEDLVQIVIRDRHPQSINGYLRLRTGNGSTPWLQLAEQVGLCPSDLGEIMNLITNQRDQLIRAEYEYVTGRYGITDGSPTYVWESERVPDLSHIATFKGLEAVSVETCSH